MTKRKTHEEFMKDFEEKQPENFANIKVLGSYVNGRTPIECECLNDHHKWEPIPYNLLNGSGCPECQKRNASLYFIKSLEQVNEELNIIGNKNIKIIGEYKNTHTKTECECLVCGHKWETLPKDLLRGHGCPKCNIGGGCCYTNTEYVNILKDKKPNIIPLEEYKGSQTKIKHKCLICGLEWEVVPGSLLNNSTPGCPQCSGVKQKTHDEYIDLLTIINPNIKVIGEYKNAHTQITHECLICGHKWEVSPNVMLRGGMCPKCSKHGSSYLQEFIYYSLTQVFDVVLYRDKTTIGKELDIVIPELKLAIEPGAWYWHKEHLDNDLLKRKLCREKNYSCLTIYVGFTETTKPYQDCWVYSSGMCRLKQERDLENLVRDILIKLNIKQTINFDKVRKDIGYE